MGWYRTKYHYLHRDLLHEVLSPERDHLTRSLERIQNPKTITTTYRVLSRPEDFTRPYGRTSYGLKSVAAAAANLNSSRLKADPNSDGRSYHPMGSARPFATVKGRGATVSTRLKQHVLHGSSGYGNEFLRKQNRKFGSNIKPVQLASALRSFVNPTSVIPCIQRKARREVIMALYGGGGSHSKKKRKPSSDIGC